MPIMIRTIPSFIAYYYTINFEAAYFDFSGLKGSVAGGNLLYFGILQRTFLLLPFDFRR